MCGIFGASWKAGSITPGRRAVLSTKLALLNDTRGRDSWGAAIVEPDGSITVSKGLGVFGDHAYALADAEFYIGHTRFGTVGAKTVENAHPFEVGNIVGAHNGAVSNHYELDKKYKRDCDVDSMHFFHHLDAQLSFEDIEGYGAIEWINRNDTSKIFLSKLKGGSLSVFGIGNQETGKTYGAVWSSDEKHLLEALFAANIKDFFPIKVDEGMIIFVKNGEIYVDTQRRLDIGKEAHRRSTTTQNWQDHHGHAYDSKNSVSGVGASITSTKSDADYADWQEWLTYCEQHVGKDAPKSEDIATQGS